ncbi:MAG TPA: dTDP-glucose 4,6-dehydratase [Verrucomicrobiae bacterium]|jgi:dTDP-glucose 4,6-dehydratase|nr:dTDP-glucose 4,6-dehydratase [Verrucomicrobiae bacterium]
MAKKTILVTGGAGFIGSTFVRLLLKKYPDYRIIVYDALTYAGSVENFPPGVFSLDRFEFIYANVCSTAQATAAVSQADIIVHFAAETHVTRSIYDASDFWQTDVIGTATLAAAAVQNAHKIERFVHISTSEVYGTCRPELDMMDEEHPLEPRSPYASAKTGADRIIYSYFQTYGLPAVIVRPFNNYGPHQHLEKAIPRFITSALLDEPLTVHGDGRSSRDWVYVDDTCEAIDVIMHAPVAQIAGEVFNIATFEDASVLDIARQILKIAHKPETLIQFSGDRPGQVIKHKGDASKIKRVLGWAAQVTLEDGLARTFKWYAENEAFWRRMLWMAKTKINTGRQLEWH